MSAADLDIAAAGDDAKRLYLYWAARRGTRNFPSRKDIDPLDLGFALGRISLVDVVAEPRRFHYRLVATRLTEHLGYEMTGKHVDEIPERELRDYVTELYCRAIAARGPLYEAGQTILDGRRWEHETLVLPLSSDGEVINLLLIYRETTRPKTL